MGVHHSKKKTVKHKGNDEPVAAENVKRFYEEKIFESLQSVNNVAKNDGGLTLEDYEQFLAQYERINHTKWTFKQKQTLENVVADPAVLADSAKLSQHPEVTKLQNRQNARLEDMEQRIARIRQQVKESAIRRRRLQSRNNNSQSSCSTQTGDSMRRRNVESDEGRSSERRLLTTNDAPTLVDENDNNTGEIIPVHVLTAEDRQTAGSACVSRKVQESNEEGTAGSAIARNASSPVDFSSSQQKSPLLYVLFPLLLPLLIIVIILRVMNPGIGEQKRKNRHR